MAERIGQCPTQATRALGHPERAGPHPTPRARAPPPLPPHTFWVQSDNGSRPPTAALPFRTPRTVSPTNQQPPNPLSPAKTTREHYRYTGILLAFFATVQAQIIQLGVRLAPFAKRPTQQAGLDLLLHRLTKNAIATTLELFDLVAFLDPDLTDHLPPHMQEQHANLPDVPP